MMIRRLPRLHLLVALICILLSVPLTGLAQDNTAASENPVCAAIAAQAITQIGTNCANRVLGTACYAFPDVEGILKSDSLVTFSTPRDRALLTDIIHLRLHPIDFIRLQWGIVTLSFPATPPSVPPTDAIGIGFGGLEIEPGEPTSDDGSTPLPIYLRTGIGGLPCPSLPSFLSIQSPRDTPIEVVINGVHILVNGTIVLRTVDAGEPVGLTMQVITISGVATVSVAGKNGIIVPPAFVLTVNLGPELVSLGIEGDVDERGFSSFGELRLLTQEELDELGILGDVPPNLTYYVIILPEIITPSGTTPIVTQVIFRDPLDAVQVLQLCDAGEIPADICQVYGF